MDSTKRTSTRGSILIRRSSSKSLLKNSKSFRMDDYSYHFANAIKVPQCVELMAKYLKKEFNSEPLEFLERLSEYKKHIDHVHNRYADKAVNDLLTIDIFYELHKEFKQSADSIINTFLIAQSPKEINVAGATKKVVIDNLSKICAEADKILKKYAAHLINSPTSPTTSSTTISSNAAFNASTLKMLKAMETEESIQLSSTQQQQQQEKKQHKRYHSRTGSTVTSDDSDSERYRIIRSSVLHQKHYQLFTHLETAIKGQLQFDVFPRFIRSEIWKDFVMQQDKAFLEQVSTRRQQGDIVKSLYTYDDYMSPVITDLDFDLIRQLSQDGPEWKLIYTHNKTGSVELASSCYIMMDYNFIVGDNLPPILKNRPFTKIVCYFPYDAPDCYETLKSLEHCYKAEKILEEVKSVNYLPPDSTATRKYATGYEVFKYKLGNPKFINYRMFNLQFSDIIDPKDTSCILGFARDCKYNEDLPQKHTLGSIYAAYIFKQMGTKLTRFTQITSMNMGGAMKGFNNAIFRKFLKNMFITRCKNMRDDLMNGLQEREAAEWKPLDAESLSRIRDLKENTVYHSAVYNKDDNEYSLVDYAKNIPIEIGINESALVDKDNLSSTANTDDDEDDEHSVVNEV